MKWIPWAGATPLFATPVYVVAWLAFFRGRPLRLGRTRTAWMFLMTACALASPVLWRAYLYGQTPTDAPGVSTWPVALFLAAPWFMLGSVRLVASFAHRAAPPAVPTP